MDAKQMWQWLDRAGIVIGLIVSAPVFYSAWAIWDQRKKKKRQLKEIRKKPGNRPSVLIIDVRKPGSASIQPQVENWLRSNDKFKGLPVEAIAIAEFNGEMTSRDMTPFAAEIRKQIGKIMASGTDRVHVFMRCPLPVAASTGEILSNSGCPVILYHNQLNTGYENWGLLHQ